MQLRKRAKQSNAYTDAYSASAPSNITHVFWDDESSIVELARATTKLQITSTEIIAIRSAITAGMQVTL